MTAKRKIKYDDELILLIPYANSPGIAWGDEGISVKLTVGELISKLHLNHSTFSEGSKHEPSATWRDDIWTPDGDEIEWEGCM